MRFLGMVMFFVYAAAQGQQNYPMGAPPMMPSQGQMPSPYSGMAPGAMPGGFTTPPMGMGEQPAFVNAGGNGCVVGRNDNTRLMVPAGGRGPVGMPGHNF